MIPKLVEKVQAINANLILCHFGSHFKHQLIELKDAQTPLVSLFRFTAVGIFKAQHRKFSPFDHFLCVIGKNP